VSVRALFEHAENDVMVAIGLAETKGLIALAAASDAFTESKETVP
jgi:hypothetical protein